MAKKIAKTTKVRSVKTGTRASSKTTVKKPRTKITSSVPSKSSVPSVIKKRSASTLAVKIYDLKGKAIGTINLPRQTFGQKPSLALLTQAIKVYQAESIPATAYTKTRGEVAGGGRKPRPQKGTGHARAGSIRSPLWVGGGTVFGPRGAKRLLTLPKKMKRQALIHALSDKAKDGNIKVIKNIEKIKPKTKIVANLLAKLAIQDQSTLLVISEKKQNVKLATRNIENLNLERIANLNAYEILRNQNLLISQEAITKFK